MSLITTTPPEQAYGNVAQLYKQLQGRGDYLPNYAGIFGHRPELMAHISNLQEALKEHMEPRLYSLVTLAAAREIKSSYCSLAFARRLINSHFSENELMSIISDDTTGVLSDKERAAMRLAARVARDSSSIKQGDVDQLRKSGFSDTEIFDVVAAAAWRCFFAKVPDSLGALPDRALTRLDSELLELLLVGRLPEPGSAANTNVQQKMN